MFASINENLWALCWLSSFCLFLWRPIFRATCLTPCLTTCFIIIGARRSRTDWRVRELLGAADAFLALNKQSVNPMISKYETLPNLQNRIQVDSVFLMGHSYGGATALTAAHRRPDLLGERGGIIAHEPAVDWMPDDARRSLLPVDKLDGLSSAHTFTGGTGGFESDDSDLNSGSSSIHDRHLLLLYSNEWRQLAWGESHILEEMHQKGRLGPTEGVVEYGVIQEANHNEFSDMCMMTPLWLARGVGVAGNRHPLETAREIEKRTWNFVSSVLGRDS